MTGSLCALVALTACGSSSPSSRIHALTTTTPYTGAGHRVFSAPGMALHFNYPTALRLRLAQSHRLAGNITQASEAAVGIGRYDLLIVSRFPHRPIPVTVANLARLRPQFDAAISEALGHRVRSQVVTLAGLPALSYPPAPVSGLPVTATSRIINVFVGDDQYELNCQYTRARATTMGEACDEMLASLRVTEPTR